MVKRQILRAPEVKEVKLSGVFWDNYDADKLNTIIEHGHKAFENTLRKTLTSGALHSLKILSGRIPYETPHGFVWHDSDLFKWYEGLCYLYSTNPDEQLKSLVDDIADMLITAQASDGYYNSFFQLNRSNRIKRLEDLRECHELYSMGHVIESCIAHFAATGNNQLLHVACKIADFLDQTFGMEDGKFRGYDGHQEIELALVKLYRVTKENRYLNLAKFFLEIRGSEPAYFVEEWERRGHTGLWAEQIEQPPVHEVNLLTHLPLREQFTAEGHAVRAVYMYTAMADVAAETNDSQLLAQCRTIWDNITQKRMYITGGVGAIEDGEKFGVDYELPNYCHAETCAAFGMIYFAQRMFHAERDGKYIDTLEQVLYNNALASTGIEGKTFWYINVLERDMRTWKINHASTRLDWQGCACCPTNVARFFPSMQTYVYSQDDTNLYVNLYAQSISKLVLGGTEVELVQKTDYPWDGKVQLTINLQISSTFCINIRLPGWCANPQVSLNGKRIGIETAKNGYLMIERSWQAGDEIDIYLPMTAIFVRPHPMIDGIRGKLAVKRGPIVYCLEEQDNGADLKFLSIQSSAKLIERFEPDFLYGGVIVYADGTRLNCSNFGNALYKENAVYTNEEVHLRFIPYYMWDNRGKAEMIIWVNEQI